MSKISQIVQAFVLSPLLWGGLSALAFYSALDAGYMKHPLIDRYLAGHWTAMVCMSMFFVGLAALVLKGMQLVTEFETLRSTMLDPIPVTGQPISYCSVLLERLAKLPAGWQRTYLVGRLRAAIDHVGRKDSSETLEDQLRDLADADYQRKHASYGVARIVVWAIPFIGCLGTVIGIGAAVANLPAEASDGSFAGIVSGLGMVFDTTALALALSVVLMVIQYDIEQIEGRLLMAVDARANAELIGRFQVDASPHDAPYDTMRELANTMVVATENLVKRQSELWEMGVQEANKRWTDQSAAGSEQLEALVSGALAKVLGGAGGTNLNFDSGHSEFAPPPHVSLVSHEDLLHERDVMLEIVEMTRQGSRNWPVRKSRYFKPKQSSEADFNGSWLDRS